MIFVRAMYWTLKAAVAPRACLAAENAALRQQLACYKRKRGRPRIAAPDRLFWVMLKRFWSGWRSSLVIVQPDTVCRWHRQGFRLFWKWKSRRGGRPLIDAEVRALIRQMSRENPLWGAPRIRAELRLLGYEVAESTVAHYMVRRRGNPSPGWKTFLANHSKEIAACDFFVVPTATFRLLYCFVILSHDRRRVLHFNVTTNPTARWTAQQLNEAFPFDAAPRCLLRDNDAIYGQVFQQRVAAIGIEDCTTAPHSPWQNPYVERLVGTVRRECLEHLIVLGEDHLRRVLEEFFFSYYNGHRPHQGLEGDAPLGREPEPPDIGPVVATPVLGGLHHSYSRRAA
ncbi:Integrase core domain protein [Posidoniimonas polymericola]|uniref:Integrase core domain protein n=1 Tax=Posidoniimonas polymericola TaxID=2528002 RepID=A0A5C5YCM4_9BACT|nr:integrase core domain-containing protein [Posidoniimonas polymericola]TWT72844.1 Integrase core domain protein [Posidoniimonas polymericola]